MAQKIAGITIELSADTTKMIKSINNVGKKFEDVGKSFTKNVTTPIVAIGAASMAAFNEVDAGLDIIIQKTGATGEDLKGMEEVFNSIASSVPASFEEVGSAIGEVNTRFGSTGDELERLSERFIKFAQLNDTDVSDAIDSTQKALAAYGKGAESASGYLDVLNSVSQATGISTEAINQGVVQNSAAFQEMGLSIEQAAAFMGQIEVSGADTSTVMGSLSRALKNATDEGIPLEQALSDLQNTIVNGGDGVDGLTASYELFGKSGAQVYNAVKNGTIDFQNLASAVVDAGGSVEDAFNATLDPADQFKVTLQNLKLAGAELGNTVGQVLSPLITKFTEIIQKLTDKWKALSPETQQFIVKAALVAAAIGPVLLVIGKLVTAVGSIISIGKTLISVIGMIASPVGLVVAAIAGLVAIGVVLYKNWDTIKKKAKEIWGKIKDTISNLVKGLKTWLTNTWENIKTTISTKWESIKTAASEKWNGIKTTISNTVETVRTTLSTKWESIKTAASNAWESMKTTASTKWENIKTNVTTKVENLRTNLSTKWESIKTTASTAWDTFKTTASTKWETIKTTITTAAENLRTNLSTKWDSLKTAASNAWDSVNTTASTKWQTIKKTVTDKVENLKTDISTKWDSIKTTISDKIDTIKTNVSSKFEDIKTTISGKWEDIKSNTSTAWDTLKRTIDEKGGGIKGVISTAWSGYEILWENGLSYLDTLTGGGFSDIVTTITSWGSSVWTSISSPFETAKNKVDEWIEIIKGFFPINIKEFFSKIKTPHVSVEWTKVGIFDIPSFSVEWYKKAMNGGMLLDGATIFGAQNGQLLGGGEAGKEWIVGQNSLLSMIENATRQNTLSPELIYQAVKEGASAATIQNIIDGRVLTSTVNGYNTIAQGGSMRFRGTY